MGLKNRKLPEFGVSLIIIAMAIIFIITVSGNGYCASLSPFISTDMHPGPGMNITVSGQNFTPNGTAILYSEYNESYTANVDKNGNTSWTFTNRAIAPYPIYAVDVATNTTSNTITVYAFLNDTPPTPSPNTSILPSPSPFSTLSTTIVTTPPPTPSPLHMFPSMPPDNTPIPGTVTPKDLPPPSPFIDGLFTILVICLGTLIYVQKKK